MPSSWGAGSRWAGGATARRMCSISDASLTGFGRKKYAPRSTASWIILSL